MKNLLFLIGLAAFASSFPLDEGIYGEDLLSDLSVLSEIHDAVGHLVHDVEDADDLKDKIHEIAGMHDIAEHAEQEVKNVLGRIKEKLDKFRENLEKTFKARCKNSTCFFCAKFADKHNVCLDASIDFVNSTISADMKFDGHIVIKKTLNVENPAPLCAKVPKLPGVSFCILLNDVSLHHHKLNGCLEFQIKLGFITLYKIDLQCIHQKI